VGGVREQGYRRIDYRSGVGLREDTARTGECKMRSCAKPRKGIGGFTLIELLVVIAIIALLMGILMPAVTRARKQGKRSMCLSNIRQLQLAWQAYADTYDGKIVNGGQADWHKPSIIENFWCTQVKPPDGTYDWDRPFTMATLEARIKKMKLGALWPYLNDIMIYRCPEARREMHRTYSIVNPMNAHWDEMTMWFGGEGETIKNLAQIKRPQERIVFVEEGYPSSDAFQVLYTQEKWIDLPQVPHVKGSNFGFADGHAEFWKWEDDRTMTWAKIDWTAEVILIDPVDIEQRGNKDLQRVQRAAWGKLGYTPSPTPE
jgi:prepilin-type N-terminal cleavage/methylation domain-containing protein/prepilin-type processing-associated H-X9-DG protein